MYLALVVACALGADMRVPVPDAASLQENEKIVRDLFAADLAVARQAMDKKALSQRLLVEAAATPNDHAGRYALLSLAKSLATEAGEAKLAMQAVGELEKFSLDDLELERQTLAGLSETCVSSEQAAEFTRLAEQSARTAVIRDNFTTASKMISMAAAAARRSRDQGLIKSTNATGRLISEYRSEFASIDPGIIDRWSFGVDTGEVATAIGKFRCLFKGDWENGLPLLAKANDATLRAAAERDLQATNSAIEMQARGDAWATLATLVDVKYRRHVLLRAIHWYQLALPLLTGLEKAKLAKRLDELAHEVKRVAILLASTDEFRIATGRLRPGTSIAGWDSGGFVVTYLGGDNMAGAGLFAQIFDANCRPASKIIKVNSVSVPIPPEPPKTVADRVTGQAITIGRHGQFAIVWNGWVAPGSQERRIYCRIFNKAGKPLGNEFRIDNSETRQTSPAVAFSTSTNRLMVTWSQGPDENADVMARLFRASGSAEGPSFHVATTRNQGQHNPTIACDGFGCFVIAWWGTTSHDSEGVVVQRFNSNGRAIGHEITINDAKGHRQWLPIVTAASNGNFAVIWSTTEVWDGERPGHAAAPSADIVMGRLFNNQGQPITPEFKIGAGLKAQADWLFTSGASMTADGELVVAFNAVDDLGRNGVFLDRFLPTGIRNGGDVPIAAIDTITDCAPAVAVSQQSVITVWQRTTGAVVEIYGRRLVMRADSK